MNRELPERPETRPTTDVENETNAPFSEGPQPGLSWYKLAQTLELMEELERYERGGREYSPVRE